MVTNTPEFGRLVREARGQQSQDEIDKLGGPYRQRQAEIERGDPIELSPAVLTQIDTAFRWTTGTAEALLTPGEQPTHPTRLGPRALGLDTAGRMIPMPPELVVDTNVDVTPLLQRWDGLVVIDVNAAHALRTPPSPAKLWPRRTYRTGADEPADAEAIGIDPLFGLTSYRRARALVAAIPQDSPGLGDQAALALLFTATEMKREGIDGLTALSDFKSRMRDNGDANQRWHEFHRASGLSSHFAQPTLETAELFKGLMRARDKLVEVVINPNDRAANVTASVPETVHVALLAGCVLFYDSKVSPELPIVIDWATQDRDEPPPLLMTTTTSPGNSNKQLPNTHHLVVDPYLYSQPLSDNAASWPALFTIDRTPKLGTAPNQPTPIYVPAYPLLDTDEAGVRTSRITLGAAAADVT